MWKSNSSRTMLSLQSTNRRRIKNKGRQCKRYRVMNSFDNWRSYSQVTNPTWIHYTNPLTCLSRSWCPMKFPILFLCFRQPFLWERIFLCRRNQDFIFSTGSRGWILHVLFLVSVCSILFALLLIILSFAWCFDVLCYSAWK